MYGPEHEFCSKCGRPLKVKTYAYTERRSCPKYGTGVFTIDFNHDSFMIEKEKDKQPIYDIQTGKKLA